MSWTVWLAKKLLEFAEGLGLGLERHDPGMRGRAHHGNAVPEAGQRVAGAGAAADVGRPRAEHSRLRGMGAPGAELDDVAALSRMDDSRGFGGDQSFEGDARRADKSPGSALRSAARGCSSPAGRVEHGAFGNGENISGEAEVRKIVPEAGGSVAEVFEAAQIRDFVGVRNSRFSR